MPIPNTKGIITIGGVTHDTFVHLDSCTSTDTSLILSLATKHEVRSLHTHLGGGAANVAVWLRRQGLPTSICALVGNDMAGIAARDELHAHGIDTTALLTSTQYPTASSVVLQTPSGNSAIAVYRGASSFLSATLLPLQHITAHPYLYITSLNNHAATLLPTLTQKARASSTLIACNPGLSQLQPATIKHLAAALPYLDVLLMNKAESMQCAASLGKPELHEYDFAQFILSRGPTLLSITDGEHGARAYTTTDQYQVQSKATTIIDTVGAGDAFGAGLIASLIQNQSIADALNNASRLSAQALQGAGSF